MKATRVEQHQIRKDHILFKVIDEFCYRSKNLYNSANYIIRQEFINNNKYIKYADIDKLLHHTEEYKLLMSQSSQCTLQVLDRNWKSFFVSIKDYSKRPEKYLGIPKIPRYKKKDGRFTWFIKNNTSYIKDGHLYFRLKAMQGYRFKTNSQGRLISVRFVPQGSIYVMEIVTEVDIPDDKKEINNVISIDLGVNNFATITNNIGLKPIIINGKGIKSVNQLYNKKLAILKSEAKKRNGKDWTRKMDMLTLKRNNRVKNFIHHASKEVIKYCLANGIDTVIVGLNKEWKQECSMNKANNQKFIFIPYSMFILQLEYKCQSNNINLTINEESYTSGTSFLDNEKPVKENYDKSRRIQRGLFKADNDRLINSDVNGSYQILRKVLPEFQYGIGASLTPVVINVVQAI